MAGRAPQERSSRLFKETPAYRRAVRRWADPWAAALSGGEDYELALTAPVLRVPRALRAARRVGTTLSVVGSIVRGSGVQVVRCEGGLHPPPRGHDHLARVPRSLTSPAEPLGSVLP